MTSEKDIELTRVNLQVQAEHVARLLDMGARTTSTGPGAKAVEARLALIETLLWKHHRRLLQLQQAARRLVETT